MKKINECRRCALCDNQRPLLQKSIGKSVDIFFVGLSAVRVDDVDEDEPLSSSTRSGRLVREIFADSTDIGMYFTNAVKCLPLEGGKIRYPKKSEMESCFANLRAEIEGLKPRKIVMFGKQVSDFMASKFDAVKIQGAMGEGFAMYASGSHLMLAAPHPSYILVYRRQSVSRYAEQIMKFVSEEFSSACLIPTTGPAAVSARFLASR